MRVRLLLALMLVLGLLGSVAQAHDTAPVVANARLGAPAKAPPARPLASASGDDRALCARQRLLLARTASTNRTTLRRYVRLAKLR